MKDPAARVHVPVVEPDKAAAALYHRAAEPLTRRPRALHERALAHICAPPR